MTTTAALIAGFVAILGIVLTQFVGERYKRFLDGSAIAAGILGELRSYKEGHPQLLGQLDVLVSDSRQGKKSLITLRELPKLTDPFFDKAVEKLGLLGVELVEDVVYVYSNIRAFRLAYDIIAREHMKMAEPEFERRCEHCAAALNRAILRGARLEPALARRAAANFIRRSTTFSTS